MCRFCEIMDALGPADWERFASRIVRDQVELHLFKETKQRTQNVMWAWMNRNACVSDLLRILEDLQLYLAYDVIAPWSPPVPSPNPSAPPARLPSVFRDPPRAPDPGGGGSRVKTSLWDPQKGASAPAAGKATRVPWRGQAAEAGNCPSGS
ncbi:UNVERIFIED_CONTAM: hypothetical protein K2H54_049999 [Gekko kuhli]